MRPWPQFNAEVGEGTYAPNLRIIATEGDKSPLSIGKFCSIADGVTFMLAGEHHPNWVSAFAFETLFPKEVEAKPVSKGGITVGHDVWIGHEALILSGSVIGDGAIVGARAVVRGHVASYAVVAGDPAEELYMRFFPAEIAELQAMRWWDWPMEKIREALPLLRSPDVQKFLKTYR